MLLPEVLQLAQLALDLAASTSSGSLPWRTRRSLRATTSWRTSPAAADPSPAGTAGRPRRAAVAARRRRRAAARPASAAGRPWPPASAGLVLPGLRAAAAASLSVILAGRSRSYSTANCPLPIWSSALPGAQHEGEQRDGIAVKTMIRITSPVLRLSAIGSTRPRLRPVGMRRKAADRTVGRPIRFRYPWCPIG